jgi:hypothetical protein
MPLGAAHAPSVEDRMRSERSKGLAENLYSTGLGGFDAGSHAPSADNVDSHTHFERLPRPLRSVHRNFERDSQSEARAVSQR